MGPQSPLSKGKGILYTQKSEKHVATLSLFGHWALPPCQKFTYLSGYFEKLFPYQYMYAVKYINCKVERANKW